MLGAAFPVARPSLRHAEIWQQRASAFRQLALLRHGATGLAIGNGHPRISGVLIASPNLLGTLGLQPVLGRNLQAEDSVKGHDAVALVSYELWESAFGRKKEVLGQIIRLSDRPLSVVGVLPPHFPLSLGHSRSEAATPQPRSWFRP